MPEKEDKALYMGTTVEGQDQFSTNGVYTSTAWDNQTTGGSEQKDDQRIVNLYKEHFDPRRPRTATLTAEEEVRVQEFVDASLPADADEVLAFIDYTNQLRAEREGDSHS